MFFCLIFWKIWIIKLPLYIKKILIKQKKKWIWYVKVMFKFQIKSLEIYTSEL